MAKKMKRGNITFDVDKTVDIEKFEAEGWTLIDDKTPKTAAKKPKKEAKAKQVNEPEPEAEAEPQPEAEAAE